MREYAASVVCIGIPYFSDRSNVWKGSYIYMYVHFVLCTYFVFACMSFLVVLVQMNVYSPDYITLSWIRFCALVCKCDIAIM